MIGILLTWIRDRGRDLGMASMVMVRVRARGRVSAGIRVIVRSTIRSGVMVWGHARVRTRVRVRHFVETRRHKGVMSVWQCYRRRR